MYVGGDKGFDRHRWSVKSNIWGLQSSVAWQFCNWLRQLSLCARSCFSSTQTLFVCNTVYHRKLAYKAQLKPQTWGRTNEHQRCMRMYANSACEDLVWSPCFLMNTADPISLSICGNSDAAPAFSLQWCARSPSPWHWWSGSQKHWECAERLRGIGDAQVLDVVLNQKVNWTPEAAMGLIVVETMTEFAPPRTRLQYVSAATIVAHFKLPRKIGLSVNLFQVDADNCIEKKKSGLLRLHAMCSMIWLTRYTNCQEYLVLCWNIAFNRASS